MFSQRGLWPGGEGSFRGTVQRREWEGQGVVRQIRQCPGEHGGHMVDHYTAHCNMQQHDYCSFTSLYFLLNKYEHGNCLSDVLSLIALQLQVCE